MAVAQARESRAALSLLIVLAFAKAIMLAGRPLPRSPWSPFVYIWQDVFVALTFGVLVRVVLASPGANRGRVLRRGLTILYAFICFWVALNVPIARELSSPLTWAMLRGAGGPLADSISSRLTMANVLAVVAVLVAAMAAPAWLGRVALPPRRWLLTAAAVVCGLGATMTTRVDTVGRHRNALFTLLPPASAAATSGARPLDWRTSPFPAPAQDDLSRYRGSARGSNVLLISLESTAARYLGIYGAAKDPTPNLTRLAAGGLVVDDAYAVYPESIKGLFSTLCSRFPAYDTPAETYADVSCRSVAEELKAAGYRTAMFHSGRFDYLGMRSVIEHRGFELLEDAGAIGGQVDSSFGIDEPSSVRRMLQWIDGLPRGQQFFATYLPIAGHHPYATIAPGPFTDGTEFGQYLNALHEGDAALGTLIEGLAARGLDRNTLIVIFGDHGEAFGQHDGNVAHTQFIYDENVRVPLAIVGSTGLAGSAGSTGSHGLLRVPRVVSLIDLAPTILDLLGLPPSAKFQGVSIFAPEPRMALFFTDYSLGWLGLRDGCWKYQFQIDAGRSSLFDVCKDPDETTNREAGEVERVRAYRERVEQWSAAQRRAITDKRSR